MAENLIQPALNQWDKKAAALAIDPDDHHLSIRGQGIPVIITGWVRKLTTDPDGSWMGSIEPGGSEIVVGVDVAGCWTGRID